MELDQVFQKFERQAHTDMKLNFKKFFADGSLSPKDAALVALGCAAITNCQPIKDFAVAELKKSDAKDEEISEALDIAAAMNVANNYYRFRHFVEKEAYLKPAGFRMSVLTRNQIGKHATELISLAVSVINGCESCVQGHEKSVLEHGGSEEQVHDTARLASTINGLAPIFRELEA
ncbi:MAG: alkyl hydroperoxide reductase [Deltaproteobacteria bacterium CG11_big_fil_rev_8_21_14_0_20_45_16]|nr:MAG: alkyl hydroperoxide reductase [Deltaproteobacteria bacterium CG11_big_fil_rev_8_21_14_0_20_45_16]